MAERRTVTPKVEGSNPSPRAMTGRRLAVLLGPMVGIGARERLRLLAIGKVDDIALSYDELKNVDAVMQLLIDNVDTLQLFDGEEAFTIQLGDGT